LFSKIRDFKI